MTGIINIIFKPITKIQETKIIIFNGFMPLDFSLSTFLVISAIMMNTVVHPANISVLANAG